VEDVMDLCTNMAIIHQGRVLFQGRPDAAITELEGRVWHRSIEKSELPDYQQRYRVISSRLVGGRPLLHVLGERQPEDGFSPSAPDLEDVFFTKIHGWN
jgi:ABC-type multidrug transport system ATPase subunit